MPTSYGSSPDPGSRLDYCGSGPGRESEMDRPYREIETLPDSLSRISEASLRIDESLNFDQVLQVRGRKSSGDVQPMRPIVGKLRP